MAFTTFHGLPEGTDGRFQGRSSDVAIIGAPIDLGVGDRPGARFGPSAIRQAPYLSGELYHMPFQTEIFKHLSVVDAGDSAVPVASHEGAIENLRELASTVVANTARLVTLGGDNSIVLPVLEALVERHGPVAFVHFDAHTDTWGADVPALTHATVVRRAVERGLLRYGHQIGIRGYGPLADVFQWGEENGLTCWKMDDIEEVGLAEVIQVVCAKIDGPAYLSIDIDVLDPAFAPGTGTPEPGGLTSRELLSAVRTLARHLDLVGMDVVEVSPPYDHADITATVANRCVMEFLAATAHRVRGAA